MTGGHGGAMTGGGASLVTWLEWLVLATSRELMLFASVGILLIGLDDLLLDMLWLARRRISPSDAAAAEVEAAPLGGRLAVFVPAWDEAAVLPAMLRRTLAAWDGEDIRLYVGCYPNDPATIAAVAPLVACDARLRLVIGPKDGPTTKGDNLNRLWAALCADERALDMRFAAVVLHDAEDHVHPGELALYRRHLAHHAMVQIPVMPMIGRGARWIGGHYGDEFAEAHGKELPLRSALGLPLPSAGVGCALTRDALAGLAVDRGGRPFRADSLTEDYEIGMLIGAHGLGARFVDVVDGHGGRIVSRGEFPRRFELAVRQKARWIAGIALAGWDHLGWSNRHAAGPGARRATGWLARWMLWRDRRAPLAAVVMLAAYLATAVSLLAVAGRALFGWRAIEAGEGARLLVGAGLLLLLWRLAMRVGFTARCHGWREGLCAVPRAFIANMIAILAARRAVSLYWRMIRSGVVIWDKTAHPDAEAAPVPA